jgi:hypothetical protein
MRKKTKTKEKSCGEWKKKKKKHVWNGKKMQKRKKKHVEKAKVLSPHVLEYC